jgi:carbon storage regulator
MLVLSRQRNETIMIGHEVEVTVIDIRGDKVRLGINAPRAVSVHRKEVYEAIKRENEAAAQMQPGDPAAPEKSAKSGLSGKADDSAKPVDESVGQKAEPGSDQPRPPVRLVDPTPSARRSRRTRGESKS